MLCWRWCSGRCSRNGHRGHRRSLEGDFSRWEFDRNGQRDCVWLSRQHLWSWLTELTVREDSLVERYITRNDDGPGGSVPEPVALSTRFVPNESDRFSRRVEFLTMCVRDVDVCEASKHPEVGDIRNASFCPGFERCVPVETTNRSAIVDVKSRGKRILPETVAQTGSLQHGAHARDDSLIPAFSTTVGLRRVRRGVLMFDAKFSKASRQSVRNVFPPTIRAESFEFLPSLSLADGPELLKAHGHLVLRLQGERGSKGRVVVYEGDDVGRALKRSSLEGSHNV